jgi:hypothetical protein
MRLRGAHQHQQTFESKLSFQRQVNNVLTRAEGGDTRLPRLG